MTKRNFFLTFVVCLMATLQTLAQSPVGTWKTIDDETLEAKSQVLITEEKGKISGKIVKFLRKNADPNRKCTACKGSMKDQPVMGMTIVKGLSLSGDTWKGGTILDPEKGKEYTCTMWFEDKNPDVLFVRGWVGPFFRTQKWYRVK